MLVHGNNIHIPLHQYALILFDNGLLRLIQAVQLPTFAIYQRFGRIDIFGNLLVRTQRASAKGHNLPGNGENRIHDP